jgi:hypothetical protein
MRKTFNQIFEKSTENFVSETKQAPIVESELTRESRRISREMFGENNLNEGFTNAIGNDITTKEQWVDQVWDMLQNSYKNIGGIKGTGFTTKEDMIKNIPMWKMATVKGKLVAVLMYKDKGGRKTVAGGTDGTPTGVKKYIDMVSAELKRSFGEKSKGALGVTMKTVPWETLENFTLSPEVVSKAIGWKVTPIKDYKGELPDDAKLTLSKYPQLKKYAYIRPIAGSDVFKVAFGTPGLKIT